MLFYDETSGPLGKLRIIITSGVSSGVTSGVTSGAASNTSSGVSSAKEDGNAALRAVLWNSENEAVQVKLGEVPIHAPSHPLIVRTLKQLDEYFAGKRMQFTLPLSPVGTPFQIQAWKILETIPYGETRSYQMQAEKLGNPQACRAVGAANGKNPISIIVPCHRVVGKSGSLTGFAGGLSAKATLLELESKWLSKAPGSSGFRPSDPLFVRN